MDKFLEWNINDPNVPLVVKELIRPMPGPGSPVIVSGFTGLAEVPGIPTQAAGVYMSILYTLDIVKKINSSLPNWSRTKTLVAIPRAGIQFNAYYDGSSLRFFYNKHPKTGKMIFACDSSDVVSHELGHALLDAWRPDLWSTVCFEALAFHESFGDMISILSSLNHTEMIDFILTQTNGDISKSNSVTRIAEQLGGAIHFNACALRDAYNDFVYVEPNHLPATSHPDELCREPHSYSRVFTGAFYELICWLYKQNCKSLSQANALVRARDGAAAALFQGIKSAPNNSNFYKSVANGMANVGDPLTRQGVIEVFTSRKILDESPKNEQPRLLSPFMLTPAPILGTTLTVKLSDHMRLADDSNPLYHVDVDIPNDGEVEYDNEGNITSAKSAVLSDTLSAAKLCLDYLNEADRVSYLETEMKEYSIVDGKLIRNYIHCFCH